MIEFKIAVLLACMGCKLIGETVFNVAQRYIMPVVIAIAVSIIAHTWWVGAVCLPMIGPITLGYKDYGSSNGFARGCWLFVICLVAGLGCLLLHHLSLFYYIPWIIFAGVWGATTRNLPNFIIAPITGLIIGSFICFVH